MNLYVHFPFCRAKCAYCALHSRAGSTPEVRRAYCARLAAALSPGLTIPCHYGMFASHGGNPGAFIDQMKIICPGLAYTVMTQGEAITI